MIEKICVVIVCIEIGIFALIVVLFIIDTVTHNIRFRRNMKVGNVGSVILKGDGFCECLILDINKSTVTVKVIGGIVNKKRHQVYSKHMVVTYLDVKL